MLWVRGVICDRAFCPVGPPHDPTNDKVVKVIRDRASGHRLAPNARVNRLGTYEEANIPMSIRAR
jgi:hypothetical protein